MEIQHPGAVGGRAFREDDDRLLRIENLAPRYARHFNLLAAQAADAGR
jgi:hypothetical protein